MPPLTPLLETLQEAILAGDPPRAGALIKPHPRLTREAMVAIYSDGYRLRLFKAVADDYAALCRYLGEAAFGTLLRAFIEATPPEHFNLDRYAPRFAAYLAHACDDAFARDLAALEGAIAEVYLLEETPPLPPDALGAIAPDDLAALTLRPRAACRLLALAYPADAYLTQFREAGEAHKPAAEASHLAVFRHRHMVRRLALEQAEFTLLSLLAEGKTLGAALEAPTPDAASPETVTAWFARWVAEGVLKAIDATPSRPPPPSAGS